MLRECAAEGRVDHRSVVREVRDRDRMRGLIVDVGAVELIADGTAVQKQTSK